MVILIGAGFEEEAGYPPSNNNSGYRLTLGHGEHFRFYEPDGYIPPDCPIRHRESGCGGCGSGSGGGGFGGGSGCWWWWWMFLIQKGPGNGAREEQADGLEWSVEKGPYRDDAR